MQKVIWLSTGRFVTDPNDNFSGRVRTKPKNKNTKIMWSYSLQAKYVPLDFCAMTRVTEYEAKLRMLRKAGLGEFFGKNEKRGW